MLFDPKWDKTDKIHEGVSLRGLIAWLETMPKAQRYDFCNPFGCALAQYMKAQGLSEDGAVGTPEGGWITYVAQGDGYDDWTFGAALERARTISSHNREPK